jgi:hypothetical protein
MIFVYHLNYDKFSDDRDDRDQYYKIVSKAAPESCIKAWKEQKYVSVASITTDSLDKAYERTNNIDQSWVKNNGVTVDQVYDNGCRSTSMGDILEYKNKFYLVSSIGFTEIELN